MIKARTYLIESVSVALSFCSEAIKKEKPNKVQCDADEIEIFSRQEEPLSVASNFFSSCSCVDDLPVCVEPVLSSLYAFSAGRQLEQGREDECISS